MLIGLNLLAEGVRVPVHQGQNGVVSLVTVDLEVVASDAVATVAVLVQSETVAVELQAFSFLTVARDLF